MGKDRDARRYARLQGYSQAKEGISGFHLPLSGFLRELHLSCSCSEEDRADVYVVDISLVAEAEGSPCVVRLRFEGVQGLTLKEFGRRPQQITGFNVVDMLGDQWDGLSWHVEDYENGVIDFYARTARIVECGRSLDKPGTGPV